MAKREKTRTTILDSAENLILSQGFSATSIDRLVEEAGITKGTFFYHFANKAALAHALVERYAQLDREHLEGHLATAEAHSDDPVEQLLHFVRLFRDEAEGLTEPYPGCLFASYCYEAGLFNEDTLGVVRDAMYEWRHQLGTKCGQALAARPPTDDVDAETLADMLLVIFEGSFMLSRTLREARVIARQLDHYHRYLRLLFGR